MSVMSQTALDAQNVEYTDVPLTEALTGERSLQDVTTEIITIRQQTQALILQSSIEIGRRLCEAKELIGHGNWGEYLKTVEFSPSTAQNLMRIFKEYGDEQISFAGVSKSQTFGHLSYSKVVALFALPEAEREDFITENNVEEMSVSELKEIIRQRDAEREQLRKQAEEATQQAETATAQQEQLNDQLEKSKKKEQSAKAKADKLLAENKALQEQAGKVAPEELERIRTEAQETARQQVAADLDAATARAEELAEEIEKAKQEAEATAKAEVAAAQDKVAQMEKKLAVAGNDDTTRMKVLFEDIQETYNRMMGCIAKVQIADEAMASKLRWALRNLLEQLLSRCNEEPPCSTK